MKKQLIVLLLMMGALPLAAQLYVTPEIGMSAFKHSRIMENGDWRAGLKTGLSVEYQFKNKAFAWQTGAYYMQRRYSYSNIPYLDTEAGAVSYGGGTFNNHYLQIPLLAKFGWKVAEDVRLHFAFGPYAALSLSNTGKSYAVSFDYGKIGEDEPPFSGWVGGSYFFSDGGYGGGGGYGYGGYGSYYEEYISRYTGNISKGRSFVGGMLTAGLDIKQWRVNAAYDISFGDEWRLDFAEQGHTFSLTVGYKFKLSK